MEGMLIQRVSFNYWIGIVTRKVTVSNLKIGPDELRLR